MNKLAMIATIVVMLTAGCTVRTAQPTASTTPQGSVQQTASASSSPKPTSSVSASPSPSKTPTATPMSKEEKLKQTAASVLSALKRKDFKGLSSYMDPDAGVRFSPYSFIDVKKDLTFKANQIEALAKDQTVYTWGSYDGSGEPIKLTFTAYFDKFVFDRDFTSAPKVSMNQVLGKGNTTNNIQTVYKEAMFMEYHYPGFDPKVEGKDWVSLRLIFRENKGEWLLIGIQHDQWTI